MTLRGNVITVPTEAVRIQRLSQGNAFSVRVTGNSLAGSGTGVRVIGNQAGGNADYGTVQINGNDLRGYAASANGYAIVVSD